MSELTQELDAVRAQQAATAGVLSVISASTANEQPVFDAIVSSCAKLFRESRTTLWLVAGQGLRARARAGEVLPADVPTFDEIPLDRNSALGTSVLDAAVIHVSDVKAELTRFPRMGVITVVQGYGSLVAAPLLRDGTGIGSIIVLRKSAGAFADREVGLLRTFAEQAVIAIENARLLRETREASRQLAEWGRTLEGRVADGIAQLERAQRLRRFLAPEVAEMVMSEGGQDLLKHHRREIAVVFLDLRGFTAFAETSDPEEVMSVLGEYYETMGRLIQAHGGTLNSYAGDGIMAFFNDPIVVPDAAARAVRMALEMQVSFGPRAQSWKRRGYDLQLGVGIAQGYATLGVIGFEGRWDYGAIGPVCNLAARLCAEAKGGEILASQRVVGMLGDEFAAKPAGELSLKGFARPVPASRIEVRGNS